MKIRRLPAAALLAAALGTATLAGATPASAVPWIIRYGPYPTLDQCQTQRDIVATYGEPTSHCMPDRGGYSFTVYISQSVQAD
ncbi:hypothetical protein [Streptosporangium carneum]|uniref:Alpha/beta hydrolase n=1 Tax=Streptosporangium carneum TaxID=47481 RepID=A0A9W6I8L4_9ACTN|nr:hypothetical protein [Streptosporangium carneum]GLK14100.1 hypothetical protein GCM10017600_75120 [Streptosporangium carneum]